MNVLIAGAGGREHALAWKLKQSKNIRELWCWPGNPQIAKIALSTGLAPKTNFQELLQFCKSKRIELIVCGPEAYLDQGLADACAKEGIACFGSRSDAAKLESSKAFSKNIMKRAGIPTAEFDVIGLKDLTKSFCETKMKSWNGLVIKASGLASGKGVFVCHSSEDLDEAIRRLNSDSMRDAAKEIVLEKILKGRECSYFVLLGDRMKHRLGFAVDHKRLLVGDKGPNTGGMGCYTPVPWLPKDAADQIDQLVVEPLLAQLQKESMQYCGCLYVGIMWNESGPSVVEFNVRFGDPEAQVLALSDPTDWLPIMAKCAGLQAEVHIKAERKHALCYVLASAGYPYGEKIETKAELPESVFRSDPNVTVFGAAVQQNGNAIVTGSGRVLNVVGSGADFPTAKNFAFKKIEEIKKIWPTFQFRSDIGSSL